MQASPTPPSSLEPSTTTGYCWQSTPQWVLQILQTLKCVHIRMYASNRESLSHPSPNLQGQSRRKVHCPTHGNSHLRNTAMTNGLSGTPKNAHIVGITSKRRYDIRHTDQFLSAICMNFVRSHGAPFLIFPCPGSSERKSEAYAHQIVEYASQWYNT